MSNADDDDLRDFDDWDQRAVDKLIFQDERGQFILKAQLFIERIVDTAIKRTLVEPKCLYGKHRLSFELKVDLARALGVLPERFVSPVRALNALRNRAAHVDDFSLSVEDLLKLRLDWTPLQVKAFEGALTKGLVEAERIACLFLAWRCIHLVASYAKRPKRRSRSSQSRTKR